MIRQLVEKVNDSKVFVYTPRQASAQVKAVSLAHEQIQIQTIPESLISRRMALNEFGQVSEMLDVEGLESAGRRFFEGEIGILSGFEELEQDYVMV